MSGPIDEATLRKYAELTVRSIMRPRRDVEQQMRELATRQSAEYALNHMVTARPFRPVKYGQAGVLDMLEFAISLVSVEGFWAEFGVFEGSTLRFIAERTKNTVYGFDSFEGLPEDWYLEYGKGHFDLGGSQPDLAGRQNVQLRKGWFSDTLPIFAAEAIGDAAFLHVDCDLYSSAKTVLQALGDRIVPGTIICFDEYFNYPGWQRHEYLAWQEFCQARRVKYQYVAFAPEAQPVVIRVEEVAGAGA
jgi:hypothetical protein